MNPLEIIQTYYHPESRAYEILITHSRSVADKAVALAEAHPEMKPDIPFIREAAMLHGSSSVMPRRSTAMAKRPTSATAIWAPTCCAKKGIRATRWSASVTRVRGCHPS